MKTSNVIAICVMATAAIGSSAVHAGYMDEVVADNPVAYWRLDETSLASPADDYVGSLDGTYERFNGVPGSDVGAAGPRPSSFPGFAPDNRAPEFGGFDDYVNVPDDNALDITGELTLEAWINGVSWGPNTVGVVAKYGADGNGRRSYMLSVSSSGQLRVLLSPDGTSVSAIDVISTDIDPNTGGDQAFALNTWYHVAAVFVPSTSITLYVNGEAVLTETTGIPSQIYAGTADLYIGGFFSTDTGGSSDRYFHGKIDEVAVYDDALGSSEIAAHYNAAIIPEPASFALLGVSCLLLMRRRSRQ